MKLPRINLNDNYAHLHDVRTARFTSPGLTSVTFLLTGTGWVAWLRDTFAENFVELIFEFEATLVFEAVHIYTNNYFSRDVQVIHSTCNMFPAFAHFLSFSSPRGAPRIGKKQRRGEKKEWEAFFECLTLRRHTSRSMKLPDFNNFQTDYMYVKRQKKKKMQYSFGISNTKLAGISINFKTMRVPLSSDMISRIFEFWKIYVRTYTEKIL